MPEELFATTAQPTQQQEQNTGLLQAPVSATAQTEPTTTTTAVQPQQPGTEDTVEARLTNLLKKDNPYLTANRTSAMQQSAARGLQNTSIAATAGEKAAIESALPIAQQDAQYYQQQGLQSQQGDIQSRLQNEQGQIQTGLYQTQGDISSNLSKQQHTQDMAKQAADEEWKKFDLAARMEIEYERMGQENKANFDETVNAISDDYMQDYMEIMLNQNFKTPADRQWALDVLKANTEQRYKMAAAIANVELDWGTIAHTTEKTGETPNSGAPTGTTIGNYTNKPPDQPGGNWVWFANKWVFRKDDMPEDGG